MIKRREFLSGAGGVLVLTGLGIIGDAWAESASEGTSAGLDKAGWEALMYQNFNLYLSIGTSLSVTLICVKEVSAIAPSTPKLDQFSLIFIGQRDQPITDGSYAMVHPRVGNFLLHLQPVGQDLRGAHYRADFSLLT